MKIEIGESIVRTWLRHIEGCQFAELNWKTSPSWSAGDEAITQTLFETIKEKCPGLISTGTLSQFLKQAEVDVLGQRVDIDGSVTTHFVDIAYHSNGLNYGSKAESKARVQKKLIRSALLALKYFPKSSSKIYFVCPFITPAILESVEDGINLVVDLFSEFEGITFELILKDDFKTRILDEVLRLNKEVADTSELFLRSWQLISPFLNNGVLERHESPETISQIDEVGTENRKLVLIVALFLSRFGHLPFDIGNQQETFNELGSKLCINPNTLRNYRDRFDRYVDNERVGWNSDLPDSLKVILEDYGHVEKDELLITIAKAIRA